MKMLSQISNTHGMRGRTTLPAVLVLLLASPALSFAAKPNVLNILADDMGWKDVRYNVSEIQTPLTALHKRA